MRTFIISRYSLYVDIVLFLVLYLDSSVVIFFLFFFLLDWFFFNGFFVRFCEMFLCFIVFFFDLCFLIGLFKFFISLFELFCCLVFFGIFFSFFWFFDGWSLSVCLFVWGSILFFWEVYRCYLVECFKWRK